MIERRDLTALKTALSEFVEGRDQKRLVRDIDLTSPTFPSGRLFSINLSGGIVEGDVSARAKGLVALSLALHGLRIY
jgi:hypothetical protein